MTKRTDTLIVGASMSGLAVAAALQKKGVDYMIIEKEELVGMPWRNHYDRLHLHTPKRLSHLPYKKFERSIPLYPSRQQVVDYLQEYQNEFDIRPVFNTEAKKIRKEGDYWITETGNTDFISRYVVIATGPFGRPKEIDIKGMETFGIIMHSYGYKTGKDFKGQAVLVVGFGNSACEIAIDLYEQGAAPSMAVRSPVNMAPRDLLGIPILQISLLLDHLPVRIADAINAPLLRFLYGDIGKLGLQQMRYGIFEQIKKEGKVPLLDIGTIKHIRQGHIKICGGIDYIDKAMVYFKDGSKKEFGAIIAAIGFYRDYAAIIDVDESRFGDLSVAIGKQKYFGKDGLYFCGFWIAPTGQIREIASDAKKIAADIAQRRIHS